MPKLDLFSEASLILDLSNINELNLHSELIKSKSFQVCFNKTSTIVWKLSTNYVVFFLLKMGNQTTACLGKKRELLLWLIWSCNVRQRLQRSKIFDFISHLKNYLVESFDGSRKYLIFVIYFTHPGFFNPTILHPETTKTPKNNKKI